MVKLLTSLALGLGLAVSPISYETSVEETSTPVVEEVVFESQTYTYEDEQGTCVIITTSETECNVKITYGEEVVEATGVYLIQGNILSIVNDKGETLKFEIGEENKLSEYVEPEVEIVYPCNVKYEVNNLNYGDVMADIEGGYVGDVVTLRVAPNILCTVESVYANGVQLVKNEEGLYTFALAEGDNVVAVNFIVDNEQLTFWADQIGNAKNGNWDEIFSVKNLFNLISWIITICLSSGFFVTMIKNKKIKTKTTDEVTNVVKNANIQSIKETLAPVIEKLFGDTFTKYLEKTDSLENTMKVLARCFCLSQEGTPEARLAIIEELTKLNNNQGDLTEQVKKMINAEIAKNNEIQNQKYKAIEELKAENESISDLTRTERDGTNYGQI